MSSSYSSLDWVLSHCAHFTVRRFICVYRCVFCVFVSYCIVVVLLWVWWGGSDGIESLSLGPIFFQCFDTVGWVTRPVKTVPNMTYNVFGRTLNLAQSWLTEAVWCILVQSAACSMHVLQQRKTPFHRLCIVFFVPLGCSCTTITETYVCNFCICVTLTVIQLIS